MRLGTAAALGLLLCTGLTGCKAQQDRDVIALLLPDSTGRWTEQDRPAFEKAVEASCVDCVVKVYNADGSADTQRTQLDEATDDGVDVVVLAAVDGAAAESLVKAAGEIPVIAYDRFVNGADYFVAYDGDRIGTLQAEGLLAASRAKPDILMLNGAQGDPNATEVKLAAARALAAGGARVLAEDDPPDGLAKTAEAWVAEQLKKLGTDRVDAVYAATDAQAEGVVAAFRAADRRLPVLTGQDAGLEALRRIVAGEQTMTVYASVPDEAERAAAIVLALLAAEPVVGTEVYEGVPSVIFEPVAVTVDNLTDTVVRDGTFGLDEICDSALRATCVRLGLV